MAGRGLVKAILNASTQKTIREQGRAIERAITRVMDGKVGDVVEKRFEESVRNFSEKPAFYRSVTVRSREISLAVGPVVTGGLARWPARPSPGWKYKLVDEGTRPHIIAPRLAPKLRFRLGYQPITQPGSGSVYARSGGPGVANGARVITARPVNHPGTAPRNFSGQILDQVRPAFKTTVDRAIREAVARERRR